MSEATLLITLSADGRVYLDSDEIKWCVVRGGRIYVRDSASYVYESPSPPHHVFLPTPLEYSAWGPVILQTAVSTILSGDVFTEESVVSMEIETEVNTWAEVEGYLEPALTSSGSFLTALRLTGDEETIATLRSQITVDLDD